MPNLRTDKPTAEINNRKIVNASFRAGHEVYQFLVFRNLWAILQLISN